MNTPASNESTGHCAKCGLARGPAARVCMRCGHVGGPPHRNRAAPAGTRLAPTGDHDASAIESHFATNDGTTERAWIEVARSAMVAGNESYASSAGTTWLHVCAHGAEVNACAFTRSTTPLGCRRCDSEAPVTEQHAIVINQGMLALAKLLGALVAAPLMRGSQPDGLQSARRNVQRCANAISNAPAMDALLGEARRACRDATALMLARDAARGMVKSVLAHELGHIVYGHVNGRTDLSEVSRNTERDADSFASSVLLTLDSPDRSLLGSAVFWSCLQVMETRNVGTAHSSHPGSRQRLRNLMANMPSARDAIAVLYGLTEDDLSTLGDPAR